jgi:phosphoribosylglycinamide formyltransferase 1
MNDCVNIAIFASGSGTNAQNIIEYFNKKNGERHIEVKAVLSNKAEAYVHERARKLGVPSYRFTPKELRESEEVDNLLHKHSTDYIILAGFLVKIPDRIVDNFENKIINIHPSLLPKFGGKGMYGDKVHKAVLESGEKESGITIHLVDKEYDSGTRLLQVKCDISPDDTPQTLAKKIHQLEWHHFPRVIESYITEKENLSL